MVVPTTLVTYIYLSASTCCTLELSLTIRFIPFVIKGFTVAKVKVVPVDVAFVAVTVFNNSIGS